MRAIPVTLMLLITAGCATPPATQLSFLTNGYGTVEPETLTIPVEQFDRLWATRLPEVQAFPLTNDTHYATATHRGKVIKFFCREESWDVYAEFDGRRAKMPPKWICDAPGFGNVPAAELDSLVDRLIDSKGPPTR